VLTLSTVVELLHIHTFLKIQTGVNIQKEYAENGIFSREKKQKKNQ